MSTITDFIDNANEEYCQGSSDRRVSVGDYVPKVIDTTDYLGFYLESATGSLFTTDGSVPDPHVTPTAYTLSKWSLTQYCRRIKPKGAPLSADYIRECSPRLALHNLEVWSRTNVEAGIFLRLRTDPAGHVTVRAILPGTWTPIDAHYVGKSLHRYLGSDTVDFSITDKYWKVTRWDRSISTQDYALGFRILGSEIGCMPYLRVDTVVGLKTGKGIIVVPVLKEGKPTAQLSYNSSGAKAAAQLSEAIIKGLTTTSSVTDQIQLRESELLKYPQDEFIDVIENRDLPSTLKTVITEKPALFEQIRSKLDLVKLLGCLAGETTGFAQIRIEEAAAMYALTGRARDRVNRNEENWED